VPHRRPRSSWPARLTSPAAAAVVLLLFWAGILASLREKSPTFDEIATAAAGYTYWQFDDYRLLPEHGNLPQRLAALPLAWSRYRFPPRDSPTWGAADVFGLGDQWFYQMGNDALEMLRRGRAACSLVAVALAALVWWWSRRLFGPASGMLSLGLCVLSPTVLANGALMASDAAIAFFLLAASLAVWASLRRVSLMSVVIAGGALGGLFLSKRSAVVIVPVIGLLALARLIDGEPLEVALGGGRREARRMKKALAVAGALALEALIAGMLIWASYGFRYSATPTPMGDGPWCPDTFEDLLGKAAPRVVLDRLGLAPDQRSRADAAFEARGLTSARWTCGSISVLRSIEPEVLRPAQAREMARLISALPTDPVPRLIELVRRSRLLPEAFVYGHAQIWRYSRRRGAFWNGEFRAVGWPGFFPYTFLVKTPIPTLTLALLAGALFVGRRPDAAERGPWWRAAARAPTLPLLTPLALYWAMAVSSHLNIGHRYLLPVYPPLFVLCGLVASDKRRPEPRATSRILGGGVWALLALLAIETACRFPNYIAYINPLGGSSAHAYRHLVDSSLDWGQDLPGVKQYVDTHPTPGRVYLSYFGTASPRYYGISARPLYSYPDWDEEASPPVMVLDVPRDRVQSTVSGITVRQPDYGVASVSEGERRSSVVLLKKASALRLGAGTYFVSASMLQPLFYPLDEPVGPWGPWNERFEGIYQALLKAIAPLLRDDPEARAGAFGARPPLEWRALLERFQMFRFARLTAYLRLREPDDTVDFSILVYRLSQADLDRALLGPPPELGPDAALLVLRGRAGGGAENSIR
jgi:hypothetical protein